MDKNLELYFNAFKYIGGGRVDLPLRELGGRGVKTLGNLLEYIGRENIVVPDEIKNYVGESLDRAKALPLRWSPNTEPRSPKEGFEKKGLSAISAA